MTDDKPEWANQLVTDTKRSIYFALAQGVFKFCQECGTKLNDKAIDELVALLEKNT